MAGKPRNRFELRRQYEAAEPLDPMEDESEEVADVADDDEDARPKKKPKAAPKKSRATKPAKPTARMRIVWQVVNDAFKPIATFEFSQKEAAEAKAAEMTAKGKGTHFVQKVKEPMPDDAPGLGASVPRTPQETARPKAAAVKPVVEEEDEETEDDTDSDFEEDEDVEEDEE